MKYYLDTEFHEYHKQHRACGINVGKPIPTIDLISIGIVSEDLNELIFEGGRLVERSYYAISKDFNLKDAWYANQGTKDKPNYWLRDNVLKPIFNELVNEEASTLIVDKSDCR